MSSFLDELDDPGYGPTPAEVLREQLDDAARVAARLRDAAARISGPLADRLGPAAGLAAEKARDLGLFAASASTVADRLDRYPNLDDLLGIDLQELTENLRYETGKAEEVLAFIAAVEADPSATVTRRGETGTEAATDSDGTSLADRWERILAGKADTGRRLTLARRVRCRAVRLSRAFTASPVAATSPKRRRARYCRAHSCPAPVSSDDPLPSARQGALVGPPVSAVRTTGRVP